MLQVTLLDFAPDHAKSYNALVEVIRRNLLLADWCDDAHLEVSRGALLLLLLLTQSCAGFVGLVGSMLASMVWWWWAGGARVHQGTAVRAIKPCIL